MPTVTLGQSEPPTPVVVLETETVAAAAALSCKEVLLCGMSGVEGIETSAAASMQTIRIAKPWIWAKRVMNEQHPPPPHTHTLRCLSLSENCSLRHYECQFLLVGAQNVYTRISEPGHY